jgi:hypothetical protein
MLHTTIQTTSLTRNIHAMLEAVEKDSQHFVIGHGTKKVAYLMPDSLLKARVGFIDIRRIEKADPGLADTIALLFNDGAMAELEESIRQYQAGEAQPARQVFNAIRPSGS